MNRIVLDTCVVTTALRNATGAGNAVLRLVAQGQLTPLVTPALFLEYEEVLKRPEQRIVTGFSLAEVDAFLNALASAGEAVDVNFFWRPQLRDPSDEMVFETAINGRADALLTYNLRDFQPAAQRFSIRIITPSEFLTAFSSSAATAPKEIHR